MSDFKGSPEQRASNLVWAALNILRERVPLPGLLVPTDDSRAARFAVYCLTPGIRLHRQVVANHALLQFMVGQVDARLARIEAAHGLSKPVQTAAGAAEALTEAGVEYRRLWDLALAVASRWGYHYPEGSELPEDDQEAAVIRAMWGIDWTRKPSA